MKKIIRILLILVVLLIAAVFILPFLFQGRIQEEIKKAANDNLNAELAFSDVGLSLFSNFPDLTLQINELALTGVNEFKGVELFGSRQLSATIDLMSIFGDTIAVREIRLDDARIDIRVLANGQANYDIAKTDTSVAKTKDEDAAATGGFSLNLQAYALNNARISYADATLPMELELEGFNHSGSGDFTATVFNLVTTSRAEALNVIYDGVRYVREAPIKLDATIEVDNEQARYTFKDNVIRMHQLALSADGWLAMPGESIDMDIRFSTIESDILHLLSVVPAAFAADLEGVQASGSMALNGYVRGSYTDVKMPGFGLDLRVDKGRFQYPDLPRSVENIVIDAEIDAADGIDSDAMKIDVNRFYLEMAENPIDLKLKLRNPYTDPLVDASLQAKVVFASLKDALPLEAGDALDGSVNADVSLNGRMSAIDEERYEDFDARGEVVMLNVAYTSDSLPYNILMKSAYLTFSPAFIAVDNFDAQIGHSDLKANGRITDYMHYALSDSLLTGTFSVQSSLLDLNDLMGDAEAPDGDNGAEAPDAESTDSLGVIVLPANIDFSLQAAFDRMLYDDLEIEDATGTIVLRDQVAYLNQLKLNTLGGSIQMNGLYDSRENEPMVDMTFDIENADIRQMASTFNTIEKLAPIASSCTGRFSTDLTMECRLDQSMIPVESSMTGGGSLQTGSVYIEKFEPLNKLAGELGIERLAKQTIKDVNLTYRFENGRVETDPFEVKLDGMPATLSGSTGFDQSIDYEARMDVPMSKLPNNLTGQASDLLADINNKLGSNLSVGSRIPVSLAITGTVTEPKVTGNYGEVLQESKEDLKEQVKEEVKEAIEEKVEEVKEDALAKAREEADKIMTDARAESDRLLEEARKNADALHDKAYNEAKKVEDSAKNPLEKAAKKVAADKIRKEADEAHAKAMEAARKKADDILAEAQKRADDRIKEAEER